MIQSPKGTRDMYGDEIIQWHGVEDCIRKVTTHFGYEEIRTPIFEHTELFLRGVGDTTDIVQKEMYTFEDKQGRSLSLRPEMTAGVARTYVQRGLHNRPQPTKLWYIGPNFRYEQPQAGRYRQHYQFGVEVFGAASPAAEAEIISLGWTVLQKTGISNITLHINSIGCLNCRAVYHEKLREFINARIDKLCGLCQQRAEKNPLRILDCKSPSCKAALTDVPNILDYLDEVCAAHFNQLQSMLTAYNIPYVVDAQVVRGLDYYTRTVFEFITTRPDGSHITVIGGGRYDGLIEEVGGTPTCGVGFGMGIERFLTLLDENAFADLRDAIRPQIFIGHAGVAGFAMSQQLAYTLRQQGIHVETDLLNRSVKAQMKYADKINAKHTAILGETELANALAQIKNMETGEQQAVSFADFADFADFFR